MDDTARYYRQFAAEFFESTVGVDMSPIRERFAALLAPVRGSSMPAAALAETPRPFRGWLPRHRLRRVRRTGSLASVHCGFAVAVRRFEDVDEVERVRRHLVLRQPAARAAGRDARPPWPACGAALRPGGVLYVSFKQRHRRARLHGGRRFTDADEATAAGVVRPMARGRTARHVAHRRPATRSENAGPTRWPREGIVESQRRW
jgi:hypothetical protein